MALIDQARRAARTPDERFALVASVADAGRHELEHDWVEWKTGVDLSQHRWHAEIAAQIVGFANRHPDSARHHGEGCAYLLIGVEPGKIAGVTPVDNADLTNGVRRYLDGPRWSPAYEVVRGESVLIVTVEPPAWGDPIFSLHKEFSDAEGDVKYREGVAYIRRPGKTEPAKHNDLEMLQKRLLASPPLDLQLVWLEEPPPLPVAAYSAKQLDAWIEAEEGDLLGHLERRETVERPKALAGLALDFTKNRSAEDYREEVAKYLESARRCLPLRLVGTAASQSSILRLGIANGTDRNFSEVQAEVKIDGRVMSFFEDGEQELLNLWPSRPWPFGEAGRAWSPFQQTGNLTASLAAVRGLGAHLRGHIENTGSPMITFAPRNVRPRQQNVAVEPVRIVVVGRRPPGDSITASWWLTARDAPGVTTGSLTLTVGEVVADPEILRERPDADVG